MYQYQVYLDRVVEEFTTGDYYREAFEAKQEYFEKAGFVYEDDPAFEQRMCLFMNWYIFDRPLPRADLSPIEYYFRLHKADMTPEEVRIYSDLCQTIHSIFKMKRKAFFSEDIVVEDLFLGKRHTVHPPEISEAFNRSDIFEGRMIPFKDEYFFSNGFCLHPVEMTSFITGEIKKVKNQEAARHVKLIHQLASMKLKHQRFAHIDVKHIYSFESRF
jgi:hypothetical protein